MPADLQQSPSGPITSPRVGGTSFRIWPPNNSLCQTTHIGQTRKIVPPTPERAVIYAVIQSCHLTVPTNTLEPECSDFSISRCRPHEAVHELLHRQLVDPAVSLRPVCLAVHQMCSKCWNDANRSHVRHVETWRTTRLSSRMDSHDSIHINRRLVGGFNRSLNTTWSGLLLGLR